ncbi:MAG: crossover junction endodeoxyribonuclease RuvC [Oscillospiraceae bacterium]
MLILGIDPGFAIIGFGLINSEGSRQTLLRYGVITTESGLPLPKRLFRIEQDMTELLDTLKPDCVAIEELFFNTNVKTALNVAQARGVIVATAERCGLPIFEYTPLQVKQTIAGYGRAEKKQVMEMTKRLLSLQNIPKPDDAADALAIALCHARSASSLLNTR